MLGPLVLPFDEWVKVINIDWDTESESIIYSAGEIGLPAEVILTVPSEFIDTEDGELDEFAIDEYIADWLSDKYGWCVNAFDWNFID